MRRRRLLRLLRFFPSFKESTPHVFEGQEARPGRLQIGADTPVMTQCALQFKEVLATTTAIRPPIVRSAARPIRFEIRWELSDELPQEVVLGHAGSCW